MAVPRDERLLVEKQEITPRTSESMARTYRRNAESAERKATGEDTKVTTASTKLGNLARTLRLLEPTSTGRHRQPPDARKRSARPKAGPPTW